MTVMFHKHQIHVCKLGRINVCCLQYTCVHIASNACSVSFGYGKLKICIGFMYTVQFHSVPPTCIKIHSVDVWLRYQLKHCEAS